MFSKENDYSYFERDKDGRPAKFVEHHESHPHHGSFVHEHEVDLSKAKIADICKNGKYKDLRQDRELKDSK